MGVHRGANLVGMSLLLLDACPFSWFTGKKICMSMMSYFGEIFENRRCCKMKRTLVKIDGLR